MFSQTHFFFMLFETNFVFCYFLLCYFWEFTFTFIAGDSGTIGCQAQMRFIDLVQDFFCQFIVFAF